MKTLTVYCPVLIGSVWRGTIRRGSDIDIEVFHDDSRRSCQSAWGCGLENSRTEQMTVTEHGKTGTSLHIHGESTQQNIPWKSLFELEKKKAEGASVTLTGTKSKALTIQELEKLIVENSSKQFLPE